MNRKYRLLLIIAGLFLLLFLFLLISKNWLVAQAIGRVEKRLRRDYGIELNIKSYELNGLTFLRINGVSLMNKDHDTLMQLQNASANFRLLPVLAGKIRLSRFYLEGGKFDFRKALKIRGFNKQQDEKRDTGRFAKIKKYAEYLEKITAATPRELKIKDFLIFDLDSSENIRVDLDSAGYKQERLEAYCTVFTSSGRQPWKVGGTFSPGNLKTDLIFSTADPTYYHFGFLERLFKADIGCRKLRLMIDRWDNDAEQLNTHGRIAGEKVFIYSPRIAEDTLVMDEGALSFGLHFDRYSSRLDSTSTLTLNGLEAKIGAELNEKKSKELSFTLRLPSVPATQFINSMPEGSFKELKGMKAEGSLSYKLGFFFDLDRKDTVSINSDLDSRNVHIMKYGRAVLTKINSTFTYYPFNSTRFITVGPENIYYAPLDAVSANLKYAVLTSEDPGFFYHRGFVPSAFEDSFLKNFQEGKFSRGGSTISMQLVKNVFLTHKKTIDRKLQETFMVWLIENLHLVSKERMFEVYLNIIEWGPQVYGIGEASRFYFNKLPSQLSLNEAVYLATIIPRPRSFAWTFDEHGELKKYEQEKSAFIERIMARRNLIPAVQDSAFKVDVKLTGPALKLLKIKEPRDTLPPAGDFDEF